MLDDKLSQFMQWFHKVWGKLLFSAILSVLAGASDVLCTCWFSLLMKQQEQAPRTLLAQPRASRTYSITENNDLPQTWCIHFAWMVKDCLQVSVLLFIKNLVEPLFTYIVVLHRFLSNLFIKLIIPPYHTVPKMTWTMVTLASWFPLKVECMMQSFTAFIYHRLTGMYTCLPC